MIKSTRQMKRSTNIPYVSRVLVCLLHVSISLCIKFALVTYDDDTDRISQNRKLCNRKYRLCKFCREFVFNLWLRWRLGTQWTKSAVQIGLPVSRRDHWRPRCSWASPCTAESNL